MTLDQSTTLAVVGATGAVGREVLAILAERCFDGELRLLASERSAGNLIDWRDRQVLVEQLTEASFENVDIAIFAAGGEISRRLAPIAVQAGAMVVDNSSAFRMDESVPLVVPEVNGAVLDSLDRPHIIANPNCSTIIALMAVTPLHRAPGSGGIERMVISTYQAASGAGAAAMQELEQQAHDYAHGRPYSTDIFNRQYLFNLFSHNSPVGPEGYNQEEMKMLCETRKIWNDQSPRITATCVRVPVLRAHCEAINLTFRGALTEDQAREALAAAPGIRIVDDREQNRFPEPIAASGNDDVLVGRIRADISQQPGKGLDLFVAGDQLRKGAALNALQIAERVAVRPAVKQAAIADD